MSPTQTEIESLKARYTAAGQEHLFTFYDDLTPEEQTALFNQLNKLDIERVNQIFKKATSSSGDASNTKKQNLEPLPDDVFDSALDANEDKIKEWEKLGFDAISQNKVCVILMAGGQGTRLGSSAPKGCYDINLPSGKSLFQLQAERILRLQKVAQDITKCKNDVIIPWYIMTSGPTRSATESFFKQHNYFGLKEENVIFFEQGTLPALTYEGKVFMETKSSLAVAPDGNGGMYAALRKEKVLESMKSRNICYTHAYCVDNCLVRVADPIFIGYCISKNSDCGAKVVRKIAPQESVGIIALRNGKFNVVEYSEIDSEVAEQRKPNGQLTYGAANIANHFYTVDFLDRIESFESELEYHIANKKIKHIDIKTGELIAPSKPNGMKLELFVFDVFPFTERMAVLEVERKEEFSPLKNGPGTASDNPETSRKDIINQHVRFVEKAGGTVIPGDGDSLGNLKFEISPLVSYSGEGLEKLKGKTIKTPCTLDTSADLDKF
ncbi:nucleotide-diphospho-sugar transferase [Gigaspora rosea]|uniref:UDP-N-acetylglucosamine diphosphorylase n=1 Tax=Gigaspora rosea TaxID=44941 RepID=A0A397VFW7_9GLOM|nr:nucleotide-diphospho-sugar transferase [Gigaspora rosea]